ncbi:MAG: carbonic anhydrase [Gammaproteobacteria bacterium]|nr:carbonic anhydrase [Gammaproteobacteria bacterium]
MERLLDGYRRFRATNFRAARELYERLAADGQSPRALIVTCCDSRVDPAMITDSGPGELFVIRNVANVVPPFTPDGKHHGTSAALEFGVMGLGIGDIIVLGHAQCGGVNALLRGEHAHASTVDFVGTWMALAADARERVIENAPADADRQLLLEYEVVKLSLDNLRSFPWIRERIDDGRVRLHGWHFGIAAGELTTLDADTGEFRLLV